MKSIPPFRIVLEPLSKEAEEVSELAWAPDSVGRRHKLGGAPDFIQSTDWPVCPTCQNRTSFVAQIDSIGDDFIFADCGMIYVFYCFDCNVSTTLAQSM